MKKKLFTTIILFLFLIPFNSSSQTNIMATDWKKLSDLESSLQLQLKAAATGFHLSLNDVSIVDGTYSLRACKKDNKLNPIEQTCIGVKNNKNLIWLLYFALIYDKEGRYTDNAYAGYIKTEFGEQKNKYLIKVKKTRLYPENNIFTESITFENGITFIIENRIFIRRVELPDKQILYVKDYFYEDCNVN
ncbi:MAG: hypothetical protein V4511_09290 [Bacteroidota bacterium]